MRIFIHNFNMPSLFSKIAFSIIMLSIVSVPYISFAELPNDDGPSGGGGGWKTLDNPLKPEYGTFEGFMGAILDVLIKVAVPVIAFFFVFTGFNFVTARGDTKKLETARTMFWYTVMGAALIIGAKVILTILQETIKGISS